MKEDHKLIKNHVIFHEVFQDTMGNNFRAAALENRKAVAHRLVCKVNPLISTNSERLRRVKILLDGIKKATIPTLFSPMETISENNELYLIYDYIKGRTLEQVMADAQKKGMSFSFDLALSIATAIADIIDSGATIIISGEKSFHGFLTPDNILFHYDGKIYLKNYGIFPYLDKSGSLANDFESRYSIWLTPEFVRREKIVQQSDVYHLGFMIYRFITGKTFALNSGEDFEAKVNGLNLKQFLPTQDKDLHSNVVNFFKKTLHPDPMKRFLSIKDFKDYIASYFHIEELSSITFNVAYFMNSLYSDAMETEERLLKEEKTFSLPEPKKEPPPPMPEPVQERYVPEPRKEEAISNLLDNIDKEKKSKKGPIMIAAFLVIAVAGVGGYLYMNQKKKAEQLEQARVMEKKKLEKEAKDKEAELQREKEQLVQDYQSKLEEQTQKAQSLEEEKTKAVQTIAKQQQEAEKLRLAEEERQRLEDEQKQLEAEAERRKQEEAAKQEKEEADRIAQEAEKKRQEEAKKAKPGQLIAYKELDEKPKRTSGKEVEDYYQGSVIWRKRLGNLYKGRKISFIIIIKINPNGDAQISSFSGNPPKELKELVMEAVKTWKYTSPKKDNVDVQTYLPPKSINFNF